MVLLHAWQLLKDDLGKSTQAGEAAGLAINALVELHHAIWDELYGKAILPHADTHHGVSSAIRSMSAVDVNLQTRSHEHTSELHFLMRNSYAVFCLKKQKY